MSNLHNVFEVLPNKQLTSYRAINIPEDQPDDEIIKFDFDAARQNLHDLLAQATKALDGALRVAEESENPRAYEVVGGLLKQIADINCQLLDLSDKKQKLMSKSTASDVSSVTNNAIFVGSTSELNQLLKQLGK